jgi:hypothetical protein
MHPYINMLRLSAKFMDASTIVVTGRVECDLALTDKHRLGPDSIVEWRGSVLKRLSFMFCRLDCKYDSLRRTLLTGRTVTWG